MLHYFHLHLGSGSSPECCSLVLPFGGLQTHFQVRLRPPPISFQVRWSLEANNTIHILFNNDNVTFESNREDVEGRLGTGIGSPLLLLWVSVLWGA